MFMTIFHNDYDFLLLGACDYSFHSLNKDKLSTKKKHSSQPRLKLNIENDNSKQEYNTTDNEIKENDSSLENDEAIDKLQKNLYRPHENSIKLYGAHANYYSLNGAKMMYDNKIRNLSFFDKDYMVMFDNFDNSSFICYPNLVVSDISSSNLQHSYPFFSKAEDLYYINCFDNFKFTDYNFIYLDIILKNKGVTIKDEDTYESFMTRLIKYQFSSSKERDAIKNRLALNFFTIDELEKIRSNI